MKADTVKWLTSVPAADANFRCALKRASAGEIREAIEIAKDRPGNKGRVSALERELRKREKEKH